MSAGPSTHLSWKELACRDGTAYPAAFIADGRVHRLAAVFEAIRTACGGTPLLVLSAYRTPAHNRKVRGAKNSQHVHGRALDLRPPAGWTVAAFHARILQLARQELADIRGVGRYRTFVHVDIRPAARLVTWNGGAAAKESQAA